MKVEYLGRFSKDLDKLKQPNHRAAILRAIEEVKRAESLSDVPDVKKLTGFRNAYRIRCGQLRIGIFLEGGTVVFARVAHRKDIYNIFP